jgi:dolichol-phosphate mannosyltransferase
MFDHMHRFLPGLFKLLDAEIISIPANHRARLSGSSHYKNLARIRQAVVDVVGIMWLQRRFIRLPEEGDGC